MSQVDPDVGRPRRRQELLGLNFDDLSRSEALTAIQGFIDGGGVHEVWTANVSTLVQWRSDVTLRRAYQSAALVTVDGMGLYYSAKLLGTPVQGTVSGSQLFYEVLDLAQTNGYTVFLLGSEPEVIADVAAGVASMYPRLEIVGTHHGFFGPEGAERVAAAIGAAGPDILLLGMSSPLKERFAVEHGSRMAVPLTLGVGGMFDIAAGRRSLAPRWVTVMCLEWLWRLVQEPRRLAIRYATTNTIFIGLLTRELARRRSALR